MKVFSPKLSSEIPTRKGLGRKSFDAMFLIFFRTCAFDRSVVQGVTLLIGDEKYWVLGCDLDNKELGIGLHS